MLASLCGLTSGGMPINLWKCILLTERLELLSMALKFVDFHLIVVSSFLPLRGYFIGVLAIFHYTCTFTASGWGSQVASFEPQSKCLSPNLAVIDSLKG